MQNDQVIIKLTTVHAPTPDISIPSIKDLPITIKSYRALCQLLNLPIKTGGAKQNQVNEIKDNLELTRVGNSFVITGIKNPEWEHKITQSRSNSLWIDNCSDILLNHLAELTLPGEVTYLYLSKVELAEILGLVNGEYLIVDKSTDPDNFFKETNQKLRDITGSLLRNLERRQVIVAWTRHLVKRKIAIVGVTESTEDETTRLVNIGGQIMREMGMASLGSVYFTGQQRVYWDKVNTLAFKELGIVYHKKVLKIGFSDRIKNIVDSSILPEEVVEKALQQTNDLVSLQMYKKLVEMMPIMFFSRVKTEEMMKTEYVGRVVRHIDKYIKRLGG